MKTLLIIISLFSFFSRQEQMKITKVYDVNDEMLLIVSNINGDVEVESTNSSKVDLTLEIIINADSERDIQKAKNELELGEYVNSDSLILFPEAPFIERHRTGRRKFTRFNVEDHPGYDFKYQFKLKVPEGMNVDVSTVNGGEIIIERMAGSVAASNVNGDITIDEVKDLRKATTVNGDITISFAETPKESIHFNTVNGDFKFQLPDEFAAKVIFESMNGELYSSFDYQLIGPIVEKSKKNGTYKISSKTGIEIGEGGPKMSFKTINGNAYLKRSSLN